MDDKVVVGPPNVESHGDSLVVSYRVDGCQFPDRLWFSVNRGAPELIDLSLNAALVALLIPAMAKGKTLELRGNVSFRLLLSCQSEVQAILAEMFDLRMVNIHCMDSVTIEEKASTDSATGFSGGVDSWSIIGDYYFSDQLSDQSRLRYLVFNNVGANGRTDERLVFERRKRAAEGAAKCIGLPLIVVDSNLDDFYVTNPALYFAKTHTLRNTAVAHLLSGQIGVYRYASAFPFRECLVRRSNVIGYADPIILPFLSSEKLDVQPNGSQYSRSEKISRIVKLPIVQKNLFVCVNHDTESNCSQCHKCMRTLLVIDTLGELEKFSQCFDVHLYRNLKRKYLVDALSNLDSFSRDIQDRFYRSGGKINKIDALMVKYRLTKNVAKQSIKKTLTLFPINRTQ